MTKLQAKTGNRCVAGLLLVVLSFLAGSLFLSSAAAADGKLSSKKAMMGNACLFEEKMQGSKTRERWRKVVKVTKTKVGVKDSPLCAMEDVPDLLLLTTAYLGQASYSVAQGLDQAEEALGLKRTLLDEIAQLEAAINGPKLAEQLLDRAVELSVRVGATTLLIEDELRRREKEGYLTPEAKALIARARLALQRARYFQAQTLAGATAVKQQVEEASDAEKERWILESEVGITGDFLKEAPKKILQAMKDLGLSFSLANNIDKAGKRLDFEIARAEIRQSDKDAREDAVRLAESLSFDV